MKTENLKKMDYKNPSFRVISPGIRTAFCVSNGLQNYEVDDEEEEI